MIEKILTGPVLENPTNVWLLENDWTKETIIVDPGDEADKIKAKIAQYGLKPAGILLTHGHFDHILAVEELRAAYRIPVYANQREREVLQNPELNASKKRLKRPVTVTPDVYLTGEETFISGGLSIQLLATPGHTAGSACYYIKREQALISGDTIFAGRHGRIDLVTSIPDAMMDSVRKLMALPPETRVYPGHGNITSIAAERRTYGI